MKDGAGSWSKRAARAVEVTPDIPVRGEPRKGRPGGTARHDDGKSAMTEIRSEVPGTVWKILVEVGQVVERGESIAIIECMKMEVPIESPARGTIVEVRVELNLPVDLGDIVAVIE